MWVLVGCFFFFFYVKRHSGDFSLHTDKDQLELVDEATLIIHTGRNPRH